METEEKNLKFKLTSHSLGKVIISGEHSVVYGKPALAFGINKKIEMKLNCYISNSSIQDFSKINLIDINKTIIITKNDVIESLNNDKVDIDNDDKYKIHMISIIINIIKKIEKVISKEKIINYIYNNYFIISITSEIPIGFGLGSSAAYNSCIVNGICNLINNLLKKNFFEKKDIILLANEGEKIFHNGTPSGIDVTCSLNGGLIIFNNINDNKNIKINEKNFFLEKIKYLLINTKIKRNAGEFIKKVSEFKKNNKKLFEQYINDIGKITEDIIFLINKDISDDNDINKFFELIKLNQKMLKNICVSNDEIDRIVNILENNGFVGKISGAGGGGFIIAFSQNDKYKDLNKLLDINNIEYLEVNMNKEAAKVDIEFIKDIE